MNKIELSRPIKATIGFTISNFLQKGIMFLVVPIYTRILSTEQYGVYSVFLSWLEIFEIITTFRISWGGFVVGLNKYENDRSKYTSSLQCLSILITTLFIVLYLAFRSKINILTGMSTTITIHIFVLMYALPAIKFWTIRERVDFRYKSVLIVTCLISLAIVILGTISAFVVEKKDYAVISSRVIVQGVLGLCLIIHNCKKKFTFYNKEYWSRTIKFNVPLIPYYLSMVILNSSDRIMISKLISKSAAGIYSVAYTVSMCMLLISSSINSVMQPWLYKRIKKNELEKVPEIIDISLVIVAVFNLFLIGLAPEMITLAAPKQYYEAIFVLPPLAASVVVMYFYQHFVNIEFYFEESKHTAIASIGAAILNLVLNYVFIPKYGYLAAGYTTLISYFVFGVSHYFFMNRICKKRQYKGKIVNIRNMFGILFIFFIVSLIETACYSFSIIRYVLIAMLMVFCFIKRNYVIKLLYIRRNG